MAYAWYKNIYYEVFIEVTAWAGLEDVWTSLIYSSNKKADSIGSLGSFLSFDLRF